MLAALAALAAAAPQPGGAAAETRLYEFELGPHRSVVLEAPLPVEHAGLVRIEARWSGSRIVSFRIEGPHGTVERRSGPPPIRLVAEVPEADVGGPWLVAIRALPSRETATAEMTVWLPGPEPESTDAGRDGEGDRPSLPRPPAPPAPAGPWPTPPGATREQAGLHAALDAFRGLLAAEDRPADACRWQDELLAWAGGRAEALTGRGEAPGDATRKLLREMAAAVAAVEALRTSDDPLLAGPAPLEPRRRRAWEIARQERLLELERQLDRVQAALDRGHAPDLADEAWASRFLGCVTACERYFDERAADHRATNAELAAAQWQRVRAAALVLARLADAPAAAGTPAVRARRR